MNPAQTTMEGPMQTTDTSEATALQTVAGPLDSGQAYASEEAYAYALALQAFVYTFPLYEMARMRAATATRRNGSGRFADSDPASTRRWVNTFIHARKLLGAGGSRVVTPNNDTLYTNAWLDLSRGPLVLEVPDTADRYYVLGFLDFWTNPFAHVGRRTTGTGKGRFLIVGPRWTGEAPAGMQQVRCQTEHVWIIGRIMVEGPEDIPAVHALQDAFRLTKLDAWQRGESFEGEVIDTGFDPRQSFELDRYLRVVNDELARNPPPAAEAALLAEFGKVGFGAGLPAEPGQLADPVRRGLARAFRQGRALLEGAGGNGDAHGGWSRPLQLGADFAGDWLQRAVVALKYIGALASEEAIYPMAYADSDGRPLSGAGRYTITFGPGATPPVDAFWSLTMYDARDCVLVSNPIDRYRIGDRSVGLKSGPGGSLTLYLQPGSPGAELEPNWLPAPQGAFYLCLRAYQPRAEMLDGRYRLPPIVRVG